MRPAQLKLMSSRSKISVEFLGTLWRARLSHFAIMAVNESPKQPLRTTHGGYAPWIAWKAVV
jgi:hypothetical protein